MSKDNNQRQSNSSRRNFLKAGIFGATGISALGAINFAHAAEAELQGGQGDPRQPATDLVFVNGRIHTMDDGRGVVSSVAIRNGRFAQVGSATPSNQDTVIDLKGRTVIPGLIESHTHFVSLANRPGYHVASLELASTIAEVQEMLAQRRRDVPSGAVITAMGGFHPRQWVEQRLPTLAELDAAVSDRPVFVFQGFNGPARTNSLGKAFFESAKSPLAGPVTVGEDGSIDNGKPNQALIALYHLRVRQTFEDKKRSALDAMAFTAKVGLTTLLDQTLITLPRGPLDPQPQHPLFTLDHYRMYDAWLALHAEKRAFVRLQMNFTHNQGYNPAYGIEDQLPELKERLRVTFPFFGDDMLRTGGIGEYAAPFPQPDDADGYAVWFEAQRLVAKAGWRNENAQPTAAAIQRIVEAYEKVDAELGIKKLRWGLQHADFATPEQLQRLKDLNCGVSASGFRWLNGNPKPDGSPVGPLFPQIIASGIPAGMHEDGIHIAPHNPWFAMHYATTGLNALGQQINPNQQVTREQALYAYTRANAWYLNRENDLGSIENGKFGDLLVLDRDYFSVPDADMRKTQPIMSVVGGKIVHGTGA
ncbi:unnamed protein product [uncultured bacterium]|nr:unnamed protein product [uncultured bacterium]